MKKFLIEYESARWAGASSHCVAEAETAAEAEDKASDFMEEDMRELYSDEDQELQDEQGSEATEDCSYSVIGVEEFDETHECWKYFIDATQSQFFPLVGG